MSDFFTGYVFRLILAVVLPYLLGSVSFGVVISKLLLKEDVRKHGSGNAGTTNTFRTYGAKIAGLVLLGDLLKGTLGAFLGTLLLPGIEGVYVGAIAVIFGHLFPVYFGFKGGKGVATAAGALIVINPIVLLFLLIPFCIILISTKYMSIASLTAAIGYPIVTYIVSIFTPSDNQVDATVAIILSVFIGALIVFMHRANIKRLVQGKENKLKFKKS